MPLAPASCRQSPRTSPKWTQTSHPAVGEAKPVFFKRLRFLGELAFCLVVPKLGCLETKLETPLKEAFGQKHEVRLLDFWQHFFPPRLVLVARGPFSDLLFAPPSTVFSDRKNRQKDSPIFEARHQVVDSSPKKKNIKSVNTCQHQTQPSQKPILIPSTHSKNPKLRSNRPNSLLR